MGALVGGLIGGVGSLLGGQAKTSADTQAAGQALTGYNYLTGQNGATSNVANGTAASNAEAQLTGVAPITPQTQTGFNNYLNSTGYQFQMTQGQDALTGSAAARGLLGSGSTAKALTSYGQGLAGQTFNNYLNQLSNQAGQGLTATGQIGQAGTTGGGNASSATQAGGNAQGNAISTTAGIAGGLATSAPVLNNFFGNV